MSRQIFRPIIYYFLLTVFLLLGSIFFLKLANHSMINFWQTFYPSPLSVVIIAIFQEIFFRGWLMSVLKRKIRKAGVVIILNAIIFALAHLIFPFREYLVPGAFLAGIGYAAVYYYYPNLFLASLTHSIFNLYSVPLFLFLKSLK